MKEILKQIVISVHSIKIEIILSKKIVLRQFHCLCFERCIKICPVAKHLCCGCHLCCAVIQFRDLISNVSVRNLDHAKFECCCVALPVVVCCCSNTFFKSFQSFNRSKRKFIPTSFYIVIRFIPKLN